MLFSSIQQIPTGSKWIARNQGGGIFLIHTILTYLDNIPLVAVSRLGQVGALLGYFQTSSFQKGQLQIAMYCKILQSLEISDLVLIIKLVSDTHVHLLQRWGFQTKWINILTQKFIRSFFIIIPLRSKLVIQTFNGLVRCLSYCRSRFLN